jgi:hypothetical protein
MQSLGDLSDKALHNIYKEAQEPSISRVATKRVTEILDAKYEKANLPEIVNDNCKHLSVKQRNAILRLLLQFEELFDGTLGDWQGEEVDFELKPEAKPYHGHSFPVP